MPAAATTCLTSSGSLFQGTLFLMCSSTADEFISRRGDGSGESASDMAMGRGGEEGEGGRTDTCPGNNYMANKETRRPTSRFVVVFFGTAVNLRSPSMISQLGE